MLPSQLMQLLEAKMLILILIIQMKWMNMIILREQRMKRVDDNLLGIRRKRVGDEWCSQGRGQWQCIGQRRPHGYLASEADRGSGKTLGFDGSNRREATSQGL